MASYLLCYLGAGNHLTLARQIEAPSMGAAMEAAAEEKRLRGPAARWFVLHAYEVPDGYTVRGEAETDYS